MSSPRGRPRNLEDYLSADTGLARLSAHAKRLLRFQRIFESATPLARHSRVANLRAGKIIIHALNGTVATKLRQIAPRLVVLFAQEGAEVTAIDIRLQPGDQPAPPRPGRQRPAVGADQKRALSSLADGLPGDSAIKNALNRLVDRLK